ncbi:ribonuclease H-like domain-containing protein [Tanacetum coccineum]
MAEQDIPPPIITAMKIPIIRKGEYDIWSMRMRQYICHTDHNLWDVIVNGDLEEEPAPTTGETSAPPAPKTAKQLAARRNQERVKSILLLAIPDEYLLKFHNVADAKSLWEAIKSRFGGNIESKKMQKNVLKHQFENFSTASNESLDKAYDRFQKLISQLEIALIMRNKPDIDEIDIDDLYNNLRVYEDELKRSSGSNSASQNLAFLSSENTGSINEVGTASGDFGMDGDDLEELDLRWQVAMLTVRVKKFIQRTGRNMDFKEKRPVSLDKSKIECYNCHKKGHFARKCRSGRSQGRRSYGDNGKSNAPTNESSSQVLVAQDGLGGYDWSNDFEVEPVNYALMATSSSSSSSSSDSENSLSIFDGRSSDDEHIPENDRFSKNGYKAVPPPITGNFLTPSADISFAGLDENSIRNKIIKSQTTELNNKTSEIAGKTNDANTKKPKSVSESVVSNPKINRDIVIIEDWTSDDEEEVSEVQKFRPKNQTVKSRDEKSGQNSHKQGVGFRKVKACFVYKSTEHLIKDCPSISTARHVSTASPSINTARPGYTSRPIYPRMNNVKPRGSCSPIKSFKLLDEESLVLEALRKDDGTAYDFKEHCFLRKFKNYAMNEFPCAKKGIKREFSVARTPTAEWCCRKEKQDPN